jgi:type II restriction enzyme
MNLSMNSEPVADDGSHSQRARVVTQSWGEKNLYCPNCSSPQLDHHTQANGDSDLGCPRCHSRFQLKGQGTRFGNSIAGGTYTAMMRAIQGDTAPSYYFLHYDPAVTTVRDVLLVPHFAIPPSAVVKRKGGTGCNLLLNRIPVDARIPIVTTIMTSPNGGDTECIMLSRPEEVREKFKRIKPLAKIPARQRALALDVLTIVRRLMNARFPVGTFTNAEVGAFEGELARLHPGTRLMRDKIRQQLQVLRRAGLLSQPERGVWQVK